MAGAGRAAAVSDGQFGALMAMLTSIGIAFVGALRWAVKWGVERLTKALDDNTASNRDAATAQLRHATAMSELSTKIDAVSDWVHEHTPVGHRAYEPPPEPESRRITREREPVGYGHIPVPEPLPEVSPSGAYHFRKR